MYSCAVVLPYACPPRETGIFQPPSRYHQNVKSMAFSMLAFRMILITSSPPFAPAAEAAEAAAAFPAAPPAPCLPSLRLDALARAPEFDAPARRGVSPIPTNAPIMSDWYILLLGLRGD